MTADKGALQSSEKRAVFVINGIWSIVYLYEEEMNLDPFFRLIKKTISRCIADLNVIDNVIKLLKRKRTFSLPWERERFHILDEMKTLINWTTLKLRTSVHQNIIKRVKRQDTEWNKICAMCITDKGLKSRVSK